MNRRTHQRSAYWTQQYRRIERFRRIDAIMRAHYMPGLVTKMFARTMLGLPELEPQ